MTWGKQPYPQRQVVAQNGMVAACDARAAEWALETLKSGGNAADAGVVAGFLMAVYEPWNSGLGGHGGHMAYYDAASGQYIGIDSSSRTPAKAAPDMFEDAIQKPLPTHPGDVFRIKTEGNVQRLGFRAMFAPTTVAQYAYLLEHFGTLSLDEAVQPALEVAQEGFTADRIYARTVNNTVEELQRAGSTALLEPFIEAFQPGAKPIRAGQTVSNPLLAQTLRRLAAEGPELFYEGEIADIIVDWVQQHGGILTKEDFTSYEVETGPLAAIDYQDHHILTYPQCANGATIAEALQILSNFDLKQRGFLSSDALHLQIEALKLAFTDRYAYVSDRDYVPIPYDGLMSWGYGRNRARAIDPERASEFSAGNPWPYQASGGQNHKRSMKPPIQAEVDDDTTFLTAVDENRNMVLVTSSNGAKWGCKVTVPGLGFVLNNSMRAANLVPGHVLSIAPFKRILRNSGPVVVERQGKPVAILSAPGGRRIISSVVTTLVNFLEYRMNIQAAIDSPRLHTEAYGRQVLIEDGVPNSVLSELESMGHKLDIKPQFSEDVFARMQAVHIDMSSGLLFGGSEPRTHGGARGY